MNVSSIRALSTLNGRAFAIGAAGTHNYFFELKKDGTSTRYNAIAGDVRPQMCASQTQVLILSGGLGYIFDLRANTLTQITADGFPVGATKAGYLDAYFIVLQPNSQAFAISGLNDGLSWNLLDFGSVEGEPGNIVSFAVDHRQIWFLGNTHGEIYYDNGDANFPIKRLEGAFMEQGCSAKDSLAKVDNSIMWLGGNADGAGVVWRANGYTPARVSNHAIESMIQGYSRIDDATAFCYQDGGHTFYVLHFPTADATLVYDVATGMWHERGYWNSATGLFEADLARTHIYVWGKHLVGDRKSGTIYQMSQDYATDAGAPIRRVRSSPDIANGGKFTRYSEFRLLAAVGVGLDGGAEPGSDPQISLEVSDDGGKTWSSEQSTSLGKLGDFQRLVRWRRLGRSNNRAFRVVISDPVKVCLVSAELEAGA